MSKIRNVMFSQEYIDIFCNKNISPTEKKLLLASILDREFGMIPDVNFLLFEYYDLTDQPQKAKTYALKEIERLNDDVKFILNQEHQSKQDKLLEALSKNYKIAELYRRIAKFNEAKNVLNLYKHFKFRYYKEVFRYIETDYKKLIFIEKRLCNKKILIGFLQVCFFSYNMQEKRWRYCHKNIETI